MNDADDHQWDPSKSDEGNLSGDDEAFDKKIEEWAQRDWREWLSQHLTFPFTVTREEDDDAYFVASAAKAPFRLAIRWRF